MHGSKGQRETTAHHDTLDGMAHKLLGYGQQKGGGNMTDKLASAIVAGSVTQTAPDTLHPSLMLVDTRSLDRNPWHVRGTLTYRFAVRRVPRKGNCPTGRYAHRTFYGPGRTW